MKNRAIAAILMLAALSGCAPKQLTPIRRGEPVAFAVAQSPKADGQITIRNDDLGSKTTTGAGTGAGAGAVAGGLSGLACGPFAVLCVPAGAAVGAITGLVAGAGVGAGVGVTGSLSEEKATRLRGRLLHVQQSHSLLAELQKNINDRAQRYWKLSTDPPAALVTVELQEVLLRSTRDEQITCVVQVQVSVQQGGPKQPDPPEKKIYQYVSAPSALSVWLDESSDYIDTLLTSASQQIAAHLVSDLALN